MTKAAHRTGKNFTASRAAMPPRTGTVEVLGDCYDHPLNSRYGTNQGKASLVCTSAHAFHLFW